MVSITKNLILIGLLALTIASVVSGRRGYYDGYYDSAQSQGRRSCETNADCTRGARFILILVHVRLRLFRIQSTLKIQGSAEMRALYIMERQVTKSQS